MKNVLGWLQDFATFLIATQQSPTYSNETCLIAWLSFKYFYHQSSVFKLHRLADSIFLGSDHIFVPDRIEWMSPTKPQKYNSNFQMWKWMILALMWAYSGNGLFITTEKRYKTFEMKKAQCWKSERQVQLLLLLLLFFTELKGLEVELCASWTQYWGVPCTVCTFLCNLLYSQVSLNISQIYTHSLWTQQIISWVQAFLTIFMQAHTSSIHDATDANLAWLHE